MHVKWMEDELDECVDRENVIDLIHEIAPPPVSPNSKKCKDFSYSTETSEESDSVEIIEVRDEKAVPHKQRRKARPRKVKIKKAVSSSGW